MENCDRRKSVNHPNKFCYSCGKYIIRAQWRTPTDKVKQAYCRYFGRCEVQNKECTSQLFCILCHITLNDWLNGKQAFCCIYDRVKSIKSSWFVVFTWPENQRNLEKCMGKIDFSNVASVSKSIPHSNEYPVSLAFGTHQQNLTLEAVIQMLMMSLIRKHQNIT